MQTKVLDNYITTFGMFNELSPQVEAFIKGLKALNDKDVELKSFEFEHKHYNILVPTKYLHKYNISTKCREFLVNALLKRDITEICVNDFNNIIQQIFPHYQSSYAPTYYFLSKGYYDKCRHTIVKYYSLNNPK